MDHVISDNKEIEQFWDQSVSEEEIEPIVDAVIQACGLPTGLTREYLLKSTREACDGAGLNSGNVSRSWLSIYPRSIIIGYKTGFLVPSP